MTRVPALLLFAGLLAAVPAFAQGPAKDQTQLPPSNGATEPSVPLPGQPPSGEPPPASPGEDLTKPPGDTADETQPEDISPDELSYGEIPDITVIELTPDIARRALDALAVVREKYKDSNLENYENWQDFVDQTEDGKRFEADIKVAGFTTVNDWNVAIITVGFAYSAITDDLAGGGIL